MLAFLRDTRALQHDIRELAVILIRGRNSLPVGGACCDLWALHGAD